LAEALLDDKVALDATILEWIEKYEEDEPAAMTEMVNFILRVRPLKAPFNSSAADATLRFVRKTSITKITSQTTSPKSKKPTNGSLQ
jgi:hypothetical protein